MILSKNEAVNRLVGRTITEMEWASEDGAAILHLDNADQICVSAVSRLDSDVKVTWNGKDLGRQPLSFTVRVNGTRDTIRRAAVLACTVVAPDRLSLGDAEQIADLVFGILNLSDLKKEDANDTHHR